MFRSSARIGFRTLPALAAVALLASACSESPLVPKSAPAVAASNASVQMVPLSGSLNGYSYSLTSADDGCPTTPSSYHKTGLDMTGQMSHLGKTVWASTHCNVTLSASPLVIIANSVTASMTAANGDEVFFSYGLGGPGTSTTVVGGPLAEVDFVLAGQITGGTGRFAGASGPISASCVRTTPLATDPPLPVHVPAYVNVYACAISGSISSVGSSK